MRNLLLFPTVGCAHQRLKAGLSRPRLLFVLLGLALISIGSLRLTQAASPEGMDLSNVDVCALLPVADVEPVIGKPA